MEYGQRPGREVECDGIGQDAALAALTLSDRIAAYLERAPVSKGAEFVPDVLRAMGHDRLIAGMYDIEQQLTALGHTVTVEYFAKAGSREVPRITITARSDDGEFLYPNINLRQNPAIPRERHEGGPKQKLTITAEGQEMGFDRKYLPPLEVERFSSKAEVRILLEESEDPDMPYHITPLYSPEAFLEARQHAVEACHNDGSAYSSIYHEQIVPAVAQRLHSESEIFGIREVPEIEDLGSSREGDILKLRSWIPKQDGSQPIDLTFAVQSDSLSSSVRALAT